WVILPTFRLASQLLSAHNTHPLCPIPPHPHPRSAFSLACAPFLSPFFSSSIPSTSPGSTFAPLFLNSARPPPPYTAYAFWLSPTTAAKWNFKSTLYVPKKRSPVPPPISPTPTKPHPGTSPATPTIPSPCNDLCSSPAAFSRCSLCFASVVSVFNPLPRKQPKRKKGKPPGSPFFFSLLTTFDFHLLTY